MSTFRRIDLGNNEVDNLKFMSSTKVATEAPDNPSPKTVEICGVEYTEEQLDNIFKFMKENLK